MRRPGPPPRAPQPELHPDHEVRRHDAQVAGKPTIDEMLGALTPPVQRQINALAAAKKVDEARLRLLIGKVAGAINVQLAPDRAGDLIDALKQERAA